MNVHGTSGAVPGEVCTPTGNCRRVPLCPCGCGMCLVHCPTPAGAADEFLEDQLGVAQLLLSRRRAYLTALGWTDPVVGTVEKIEDAKRRLYGEALERCGGELSAAAEALGIDVATLYRWRMKWAS